MRSRVISRERSFSAIVILTLAIGIGACTAVFSIINALLLGSLPYPHPEQLTLVWESDRDNREQTFIVAYPNYEDWKRETRSFQSMGIWEYRTFNVASDQEPEQVPGIRASSSLFTTLAVSPAMGRVFSEQEEAPGHRVAVISDSVWRTHLGGSAAAIGKQLRLNGEPFEVIGVMPPGFEFPQARTGVWVPFGTTDQDRERGVALVLGRRAIASGRGVRRGARGRRTGWPLASAKYEDNRDEGATLTRMSDQGVRILRTMLTALMGAVAMVLLIGCVNIANLQLGRALARRREFVVRLALGAGMGRLARQLFAESLVLALLAGSAACS